MWRFPCFRRRIFPVPVTLNLLATAFRVFAVPFDLAMGAETSWDQLDCKGFFALFIMFFPLGDSFPYFTLFWNICTPFVSYLP